MKFTIEFADGEAGGMQMKCSGDKNGITDDIEKSPAAFVATRVIEWLNQLEKKSTSVIQTIQ